MVSNVSGGRPTAVTNLFPSAAHGFSWSPDGEWIATFLNSHGKMQVAKIRPEGGATPVFLPQAELAAASYAFAEWSPANDWILYPWPEGLSLISPDGVTVRKLTSRRLSAYSFSKDGRQVYGIFRNVSGGGAQWQLYSVDVKTGTEKMLAPLDLPATQHHRRLQPPPRRQARRLLRR